MNKKDIVTDWKIRCVNAGVSLSNVIESAGFDPAVATYWSNRNNPAPEAEFVANLTNYLPWPVIYNIVDDIEWPLGGRGRIIDTYVRIENAMREAEAANAEVQ